MNMTDLSALEPPPELLAWVRAADPVKEIHSHAVEVDLTWWNEALKAVTDWQADRSAAIAAARRSLPDARR